MIIKIIIKTVNMPIRRASGREQPRIGGSGLVGPTTRWNQYQHTGKPLFRY